MIDSSHNIKLVSCQSVGWLQVKWELVDDLLYIKFTRLKSWAVLAKELMTNVPWLAHHSLMMKTQATDHSLYSVNSSFLNLTSNTSPILEDNDSEFWDCHPRRDFSGLQVGQFIFSCHGFEESIPTMRWWAAIEFLCLSPFFLRLWLSEKKPDVVFSEKTDLRYCWKVKREMHGLATFKVLNPFVTALTDIVEGFVEMTLMRLMKLMNLMKADEQYELDELSRALKVLVAKLIG